MNKSGKILSINPPYAIPGGEVVIECEGFQIVPDETHGCFFNGEPARLIGASAERVLAVVPEELDSAEVEVCLESGGEKSEPKTITVGKKLADDLHLVSNPAVDPKDDSVILSRSGARGQQLPVTLFRLETDGYLAEMGAEILNPTGIAFNQSGELFVTARANGEVCRISHDEEVLPYASNLGIATGLAFDSRGEMYVGDRSGTVFRVKGFEGSESFALLEPSVSAYHLAFDRDDNLYVTAPGLCSYDSVIVLNKNGEDSVFYRGLGRPQGLAFDRDGNLYVAACLEGRHGVVRITPDGKRAEIFVAGMNVVGLCFTRKGELLIATNDSLYSLPVDIYGTLLD